MGSMNVHSQIVIFNDANFKSVLLLNEEINTNGDDEIQVAEAQFFSGKLDCSDNNIVDLTGIEQFISLTELNCSANSLADLDISQNVALERLICYFNLLTSLKLGNNEALKFVNCDGNLLSNFSVNHNYLDTLICRHSESSINFDFGDTISLSFFDCNNNSLSSLDVSNLSNLKTLFCDVNLLSNLDISNNLELEYLECKLNPFTSIDLTNNSKLKYLGCGGTSLTSLDLSNNLELEELRCDYTPFLTFLDVSANEQLTRLDCFNSSLELLNVKNTNNINFTFFDARLNEDLECIQVDDTDYSNSSWGLVPPNSIYSESCDGITNLNEIGKSSIQYLAYPNPTSQELIIELDKVYAQIDIEIYDHLGVINTTHHFNYQSKIELSLEGKTGLFFVKVITVNKEFRFSILKQ